MPLCPGGVQGRGQRGCWRGVCGFGAQLLSVLPGLRPQRVLEQGAPHLDSGVTCSLTKEIMDMKKLSNV